jgi:F0F1-type ATP synthase epsilon subunit
MKCVIISPERQDDFQGITSIHLATVSGERELLKGHIALITKLQEGPSVRLTMAGKLVRVTIAPESFFKFASDNAEVITAHYSIGNE